MTPSNPSPDTGAGTPLTDEERSALSSVLTVVRAAAASEFAPYMDGDPVDAFLGALAAVDPPLTVRPATDPAGLDVERLTKAMRYRRVEHGEGDYTAVPPTPEEVAAEYARLSVADGPGPEERPEVEARGGASKSIDTLTASLAAIAGSDRELLSDLLLGQTGSERVRRAAAAIATRGSEER